MIFKKTDKSNYSIKTYSRGMRYGENGVSYNRQIAVFLTAVVMKKFSVIVGYLQIFCYNNNVL